MDVGFDDGACDAQFTPLGDLELAGLVVGRTVAWKVIERTQPDGS